MTTFKTIINQYNPQTHILESTITGQITIDDIRIWEDSFKQAANKAIQAGAFTVVANGYDYEPQSVAVHRAWREVFISTLENRPACKGVAFVHHNPQKMAMLQNTEGNEQVGYFSSLQAAQEWLQSVKLS